MKAIKVHPSFSYAMIITSVTFTIGGRLGMFVSDFESVILFNSASVREDKGQPARKVSVDHH